MARDGRVFFDTFDTYGRTKKVIWQRARTVLRTAGPVALSIAPRMPVVSVGTANQIGRHVYPSGDPAFDRQFVIRGGDGFAQVWAAPELRELVTRLPGLELVVDHGDAQVLAPLEVYPSLAPLSQAVLMLATQGMRFLESWEAAAAALGATARHDGSWLPDGSAAIEASWMGRPVTIDGMLAARAPSLVYTRARCHVGAGLRLKIVRAGEHAGSRNGFDAAPDVAVDGYEILVRRGGALSLAEPQREAIAAVRPALIIVEDGEATVYLDGLVTDPTALQRAMSIAAAFADESPRGLPYR